MRGKVQRSAVQSTGKGANERRAALKHNMDSDDIVSLFGAQLLSQEPCKEWGLPERYEVRPLQVDDFKRGHTRVLSELSSCEVTEEQYRQRFAELRCLNNALARSHGCCSGGEQQCPDGAHGVYFVVVVVDKETDTVVGSATAMVELKFTHGSGHVAHIEDVVVKKEMRSLHLGAVLVSQLVHIARGRGCYKVILCCTHDNEPFYEKCGFVSHETEMVCYF